MFAPTKNRAKSKTARKPIATAKVRELSDTGALPSLKNILKGNFI